MTTEDVHRLATEGRFPGPKAGATVVETHISWIILTELYAFKIKKPVVFDFLDFSTLASRKHYCEEEVRLNNRLAPHIYIGVLPVGRFGIGDTSTPPEGYAVQMHRLDNNCEMHRLLEAGKVTVADMHALAAVLAPFHQAHVLPAHFSYSGADAQHDFQDLFHLKAVLSACNLPDFHLFEDWKTFVGPFLNAHEARIKERIRAGWWVEGHGDLHSRNIFLLPDQRPVVFDCIEFNAHFRSMDVLDELAFLCMDSEMHGRADLATAFVGAYKELRNCFEIKEDESLFLYFKAYRANVRLKIAAISAQQHPDSKRTALIQGYWNLLKNYMEQL